MKYKEENHGMTYVPERKDGRNKSLHRWTGRQREAYKSRSEGKSSSLTDERIRKLDELGFQWEPDSHVIRWAHGRDDETVAKKKAEKLAAREAARVAAKRAAEEKRRSDWFERLDQFKE